MLAPKKRRIILGLLILGVVIGSIVIGQRMVANQTERVSGSNSLKPTVSLADSINTFCEKYNKRVSETVDILTGILNQQVSAEQRGQTIALINDAQQGLLRATNVLEPDGSIELNEGGDDLYSVKVKMLNGQIERVVFYCQNEDMRIGGRPTGGIQVMRFLQYLFGNDYNEFNKLLVKTEPKNLSNMGLYKGILYRSSMEDSSKQPGQRGYIYTFVFATR